MCAIILHQFNEMGRTNLIYYAAVLYAALRVSAIHPSHTGFNLKTKKRRKIKIGTDVPHGTHKWSADFQFKRSKVKVTGRKTTHNCCLVYLEVLAPADQVRQAPTEN